MMLLTVIAAVLIFGGLVTVHEFGHFITAKLSRMYVEEFSIGMGPQIVAKQWGETRYTLRLLPLGGYVRVLGEDIAEEERNDIAKIEVPEERRYQNRPVWQRMIFAAAGSVMNVIAAILIFAVLFLLIGVAVPIDNPDTTISAVVQEGPAAQAGVQPGDKILAVDGNPVATWDELNSQIMAASPDTLLTVLLERQGEQLTVQIQPVLSEDGSRTILGIYAQSAERQAVGPIKSIQLGCNATWQMTTAMVDVLGDLFTGKIDIMDEEEGLTGPVGIVQIIDQSTKAGWVYVMNLAALLSINLAVINLLPVPPLDGSKLVFLLIEGIRGKAIDPMKEGYVNLIGFSLMMLLIVLVTYKDILRLFTS